MRLLLIRHAESESNAHWDQVVESSQLNAHLSERGQQQARKLADWMAARVPKIDAIYISSLYRTMETAAPLEALYQIKAEVDDRIREGGYCYSTGAPIEDDLLPIKKTVNFHHDPFAPFASYPAGVECYNDVRTRVGSFISHLIDMHSNQTVVVVNHGWILNAFLDHVFNVGSFRSAYIYAENTSISYLEYVHPYRMGPWRVYFIGQTPHLDVIPDGLGAFEAEA